MAAREDQKNRMEEMPTEEELAWLDMQCDALDRAAAEDAWVAHDADVPGLTPTRRGGSSRVPAEPDAPAPRVPAELREPCSMDEY